MTAVSTLLGIPPEATPAWVSLTVALDRLAEQGRRPVCASRPDQWSAHARSPARRDAAEACSWCPVQSFCAAYADAADERCHVWGGVDRTPRTTRERTA